MYERVCMCVCLLYLYGKSAHFSLSLCYNLIEAKPSFLVFPCCVFAIKQIYKV